MISTIPLQPPQRFAATLRRALEEQAFAGDPALMITGLEHLHEADLPGSAPVLLVGTTPRPPGREVPGAKKPLRLKLALVFACNGEPLCICVVPEICQPLITPLRKA